MVFFAVALAPGGNVAASLRSWARRAGSGEAFLEQGLPPGLYLGHFGGSGAKDIAKAFRSLSPRLLDSLPPSIHLDRLVREEEGWYLASREDLGPAANAARTIAALLGLEPLEEPPLWAGPGFFAGKNVTMQEPERFSFRHLDALLVRIEVPDGNPESLAWTVICRVRRLVGPGSRTASGPRA